MLNISLCPFFTIHLQDLHVLNAYLQHALFTAAAATKAAEEMERQRSQLERSYAELSARCSDVTAISINTKAKFTAELARSCKIAEVGGNGCHNGRAASRPLDTHISLASSSSVLIAKLVLLQNQPELNL